MIQQQLFTADEIGTGSIYTLLSLVKSRSFHF